MRKLSAEAGDRPVHGQSDQYDHEQPDCQAPVDDAQKSSYSHATGNCIEVIGMPGTGVGVRDSQSPGGGTLRFSSGQWDAFIAGVRETKIR